MSVQIAQIDVYVVKLPQHYRVGGHTSTPGQLRGTNSHFLIVKIKDGWESRKAYTIRHILSPPRTSLADTVEKFYECTRFSEICSDDKAGEIASAVQELERFHHVSEFTGLCDLAVQSRG